MRGAASLCLLVLLASPSWAGRAVVDWRYDFVNVRSGPGPGRQLVGRLSNGAETEVLEERREWVRVRYSGGEGWVVGKSLRHLPEPPHPVVLAAETADRPGALLESPPATPAGGADPGSKPKASGPSPEKESESPTGEYLSQYTDERAAQAPDTGGSLLRVVSGLLFVLALVAAAVYLVRRLMGYRFIPQRGAGIRVLATRSVGPRHGLLLVETGGLVWLLAQGPDGLRLVSDIRDPDALRRLNDRYGFLEAPFESELRRQLDEEEPKSQERAPPEVPGVNDAATPELSPEERLATLRRRPKPGGGT